MLAQEKAKLWYMFHFTLPKNPSRVRVSVWRKLKKIGALNFSMGGWILPERKACLEAFRAIHCEVQDGGGQGYLSIAQYIGEEIDSQLIERFNQERNMEYAEFIEKCEDLLLELEEETRIEKFTFPELEENDSMHQRLSEWLAQIKERDYFDSDAGKQATAKWTECLAQMEVFEEETYRRNGVVIENPV